MKKVSHHVEVAVDGDDILITQSDSGHGEQVVIVNPDQVVQLIEWLRDARDEIRGSANA
jgi:hypothetical protein